tara:strand:- start:139 stop:729 length:591 start_codon:yes stop_codon:yes gene_type:complete
MAEKTNDDIVLETLGRGSVPTPNNVTEFLKQLTNEIGSSQLVSGETDVQTSLDSITATLLELTKDFELQDDLDIPDIDLTGGAVGLVESGEPVDLTPIKTEVVEKTVVQREITVSSDQVDKQTVNEIDFNKSDFTATRDGDVLTVSIKGELGGKAFVSPNDPALTQTVTDGEFWFWTEKGKLYIRYDSYWVQPHPT